MDNTFLEHNRMAKHKKEKHLGTFPVYFDEYSKDWSENLWCDYDGNVYFESELIFLD